MATHHSIQIEAHPNVYTGKARSLRVDYAIPNAGVQAQTGMLLLVPGYLGHIDSRVYRKMRMQFADQYQLVVVQCAYFGQQFMQKPDQYVVDNGRAVLGETIDNFNDMGWMQAIDLVTAVCAIRARCQVQPARLIGYGHSHGAYLLYLANRLYPVFTYIIDNCARLRTDYFIKNRVEEGIHFSFLAKDIVKHPEYLDLAFLLNEPQPTQILSLQGDADEYVDHIEKEQVLSVFPNGHYKLITADKVDGVRFKSNTHGLDADFLQIFNYAMNFEQPIQLSTVTQEIWLDERLIFLRHIGIFPHFDLHQMI